MSRKERLKALGFYYRLHPSLSNYICYYCGDIADTKDHIPPLLTVYQLGPENFKDLVVVRACRWCNTKLGSKMLTTSKERKACITEHLRKQLNKLGPEWTEQELGELGPTLRQSIEDRRDVRDWLKRRIANSQDNRS